MSPLNGAIPEYAFCLELSLEILCCCWSLVWQPAGPSYPIPVHLRSVWNLLLMSLTGYRAVQQGVFTSPLLHPVHEKRCHAPAKKTVCSLFVSHAFCGLVHAACICAHLLSARMQR